VVVTPTSIVPAAPSPSASAGRPSDYLANERTFLAWIRTSIAVLGLGFVVAKFAVWLRDLTTAGGAKLPPSTTPGSGQSLRVGVGIMAASALLAALALIRYHSVRVALERGHFVAARWSTWIVTGVVIVTSAVLVIYVLISTGPP
jgi:putative membrane protein